MKKTIIAVIIIVLIAVGIYAFSRGSSNSINNNPSADNVVNQDTDNNGDVSMDDQNDADDTPVDKTKTVIGKSVDGNNITAYHYGSGEKEILFVAGVHAGYDWNTVLVARELMNYLKTDETVIPANLKVTVIPVLNPDGLKKVVGTTGDFTKTNVSSVSSVVEAGRFNGNTVDINRNFDCDWQENAKWQSKTVSGGTSVFSEPESLAVKNYVETNKPTAVVSWYSAAGGVYASSCHNSVSTETNALTQKFADASGYPAYQSFDFYATTGDMVNWFAKINIPAISVLLTNHTDTEWTKNKAGVDAVLKYYSK